MFTLYQAGQNATGARFSLEKEPEVVGAVLGESYSDSYIFSWLTDSAPRTFFEVAGRITGVIGRQFAITLADHSSHISTCVPLRANNVQAIRMADTDEPYMLKWQRVVDPGMTHLTEGAIKIPKPGENEDVPLRMLMDLWRQTGMAALTHEVDEMGQRVRAFVKQY